MIHSVSSIQQTFLKFIRATLGEELYQMWFAEQFQLFCGETADELYVSADSPFVLEWYRRSFQSLFQDAAAAVIPGFTGSVQIRSLENLSQSSVASETLLKSPEVSEIRDLPVSANTSVSAESTDFAEFSSSAKSSASAKSRTASEKGAPASTKPLSRSGLLVQRQRKATEILRDAQRVNIPEMMNFLAGSDAAKAESSCAASSSESVSAVRKTSAKTSGRTSAKTSGQTSAKTSGQTSAKTLGKTSAKTLGQTSAKTLGQTSAKTSGKTSNAEKFAVSTPEPKLNASDSMSDFIHLMDQLHAEGKIQKSLVSPSVQKSSGKLSGAKSARKSKVKAELKSEQETAPEVRVSADVVKKTSRSAQRTVIAPVAPIFPDPIVESAPTVHSAVSVDESVKTPSVASVETPSEMQLEMSAASCGSQKLQELMANVLKLSAAEAASETSEVESDFSGEKRGAEVRQEIPAVFKSFGAGTRRVGHIYGTFETFVDGYSNRVAYSTARGIHRNLGLISPVLFTGGTGVGKTHLLDAIYRDALAGGFHSVYKTCEEFMNDFVGSIRDVRKKNEFYSTYRQCDVLILDNLQFLLGKQGTALELKSIFSYRIRHGKQIVLASDRSLEELEVLGPELFSQLRGGCACHISEPSFDVRLGILAQESRNRNLPLTENQQKQLATQYEGDARALLGALNTLEMMARAQFSGSETRAQVSSQERTAVIEQLVESMMNKPGRTVSLDQIKRFVAVQFAIDVRLLSSGKRTRKVSQPRMLAMWLARKFTRKPLSEIGQSFGCASHSTVISAQKKVEEWRLQDTRLQTESSLQSVNDLLSRLESQLHRSL